MVIVNVNLKQREFKMGTTKFVVSIVDHDDSYDGKARVLLIADKMEEARAFVRNDMEDYIDAATDDNGNCPFNKIDFDKMSIRNEDGDGCEWNIEPITC